jgi:cell division septation protein DedD
VSRDPASKLAGLASADGVAAYGVAQDGSVTRLTQAGSWTFKPPTAAHDVVPQPDGTLLVLGNRGSGTIAWLIRPPDAHVMDSVLLPRVSRAIRTPAGDRVYFPVDSGLVGVRGRDLQIVPSIRLRARPRAVVTSPSGDRIYATTDANTELLVIDRYSSNVTTRITLPTAPTALRMDPTGRYVLARAASGDSAYIIAVGTDRMTGAVATEWRADLPAVASNGWIALVRGRDVVFADAESQATVRTVAGGAADDWMFVTWNGFRPRAAGMDQPVTFETNDSSGQSDTTENPFAGQIPGADTLPTEGVAPAAPPAPRPAAPDSARTGFTVQFAALRVEAAAADVLHSVHVQGATPRIVATARDGVTIYRVVIGPFATREDAERVARTSGKSYWVYQGAP